jgi:peptidoglycan/xylan/chitin deacetylase (PgdA/CDA1 family)
MNPRSKKQKLLTLLPDTLVMTHGPPQVDARYLTFDDGPHPEHTPRLLDLLAEYGMHASFFVVGRLAEGHPALLERIVAEGHLLGNHSYNHKLFARLPLNDQLAEIQRTDALLEQFDQHTHHRMRPPQGHIPLPLMLHFMRRRRCITYWSYDSLDYRHQSFEQVAQRMLEQPPRAREIILMHDDSACAVDVLGQVLPQWRKHGHVSHALPAETA